MGANDHAAGDILDKRYRLVRRLGRGGFGDVWRAEELLPDGTSFREVALKVLTTSGADALDWAEEAKLLASFRHPSLVTIYAAGVLDTGKEGTRFVAMELLEGTNLSDLLRARGKIAWRQVLRWATSAAHALDVIHGRGVVHLDLKPANLFLTNEGELKVLDFGIARRAGAKGPAMLHGHERRAAPSLTPREQVLDTAMFVAEREAASKDDAPPPSSADVFGATRPISSGQSLSPYSPSASSRAVVGTPGFMAPEVLELAEPTAAADAYALAVCLVQLATGHLPHAAPDEPPSWDDPTVVSGWLAEIRAATVRGALKSFESSPGSAPLPRGLVALVKRLLQVDPIQRKVAPGELGAIFESVWERPYGMPEPPYAGLAPLSFEAEGALFGRDDDIARLGRELEYESTVVLQGGRGVGKTSLVVAGVVPYLARRGADGKDEWLAVRVAPGEDPDAALGSALAEVNAELADKDADGIAAWASGSPIGIVIVVDPLEDLFLAPADRRTRLDALLLDLASRGLRPGVRLIVVVREEHVNALLEAPFGEALRASLRFVGAPSASAIRDIVGAPAHFSGVQVFAIDAIVAEVQRELRADASRLGFVSLALRMLWEKRERDPATPGGFLLRGERWTALGGVKGALAIHAERVVEKLGVRLRGVTDEVLLQLASSESGAVTWDEDDLVAAVGAPKEDTLEVLDLLARERLVVRRADSVAFAHEALVKAWPRVAQLRLQHVARVVFVERIREAATAWERAERARDQLLTSAILKELRENPALGARGLGPRERVFVEASRRKNRVDVALRVATFAVVALVLVAGLYAKRALDRDRERAELSAKAAAHAEYVETLVSRARKTEDPFVKTAFLAEAMVEKSGDGLLPFELAKATESLPHARFLSLEPIAAPSFPWDDRFLIGEGSGGALVVVDFKSKQLQAYDEVAIDADPEEKEQTHFGKPVLTRFRPDAEPIVERVAFSFDTAFVTRSLTGEVKVFRLRDDGSVKLAAIAPMKCAGALAVAASAPVLACATADGIARWDLRKQGEAAIVKKRFEGRITDVSPDGKRVVAVVGKVVLLWSPEEQLDREIVIDGSEVIHFAVWSPRERAVAVASGPGCVDAGCKLRVEVFTAQTGARLFSTDLSVHGAPTRMRWDEGGLDVGICSASLETQAADYAWVYLRSGARAKDDPPPKGSACTPPRNEHAPAPIADDLRALATPADYAKLTGRDVGHPLKGGWRISPHRFLSSDLVLFDASAATANDLLHFAGKDATGKDDDFEDEHGRDLSAVAVVRTGALVGWQVGEEIRTYSVDDDRKVATVKGNLLRACDNGHLLTWTSKGDKRLFTIAGSDHPMVVLERRPGFVLGADSTCSAIYTQTLDGTIEVSAMDGSTIATRPIAHADGYVFDVELAPARHGVPAGLWLAVSSGAIARIDEGTNLVRVLGYATPRATAIADGARGGSVVFADATGVVVLDEHGRADRILEATNVTFRDLVFEPGGSSMLLASRDRISVLDVARKQIVDSLSWDADRFAPWDSEGSILAWTFDHTGGATGLVIPGAAALARRVATAASNMTIDKGRLTAKE